MKKYAFYIFAILRGNYEDYRALKNLMVLAPNFYIPISVFICRNNKRNRRKKYAFYIFAILRGNYGDYRGL